MAFSCYSPSASMLSVSAHFNRPSSVRRRFLNISASLSSAPASPESSSLNPIGNVLSTNHPPKSFAESSRKNHDPSSMLESPNGNPFSRFMQSAESTIERTIFDFRFLALLAVGGSLAGSVLCFLNGSVYIIDAYKVYWTSCVKGVHTGQMVLRLVEAIDVYLAGTVMLIFDMGLYGLHLTLFALTHVLDVYLAGTVMLIFGMGLYGLFISNVSPGAEPSRDHRALTSSSLFGMFMLKERPKWMQISSLDELKTKVGHVIVMILLVKMFERSKMVTIATGTDLLCYSVCIFLSSASLYILHNLHKSD